MRRISRGPVIVFGWVSMVPYHSMLWPYVTNHWG